MSNKIYRRLRGFLIEYVKQKKTYIETVILMQQMAGDVEYNVFAEAVLRLESEGVLVRVKSSGVNGKVISLANKYSVSKQRLRESDRVVLQKEELKFDSRISLEYYYNRDIMVYQEDVGYIMLIDEFLKKQEIPTEAVFLPKLSYELVKDEKWLQEKSGIALLKRIKVWKYFQAAVSYEPLTFALNPELVHRDVHMHLIVENKTPFVELMAELKESAFTTLIYGAGWQIVSSINNFKKQVNTDGEDRFYYFGDLDYEGIHIWNCLNEQIDVKLALPFYEALLKVKPSYGKETQKLNEGSMEAFLKYFSDADQELIVQLLMEKMYYPQETINREILCSLMKEMKL